MRGFFRARLVLIALAACGSSKTVKHIPVGGGEAGAPAGDGSTEPPPDPSCDAPTGAGTMHGGSLTEPETWTAAGSPYLLPYDTSISATLTLEPCTVVRLAAGRTVTVGAGGSIVAEGLSDQHVTIEAKDSAPWASIRALDGGTLSLTYTDVRGGGDPLNANPDYAGALDIRADQAKPPVGVLHAHGLDIAGSASQGVYLHESGAFDENSVDVAIHGCAGYPIQASANLAGTIPTGDYTGNASDEILLAGSDTGQAILSWDVVFRDRGVPYHIGTSSAEGRLDVGGNPLTTATLTIEPGVELRFKRGGALYVDYQHGALPATGTLIAVGTSDKPITFTSAPTADDPTHRAGDWLGLNFGDQPDARDQLDFVRVQFAGGESDSGSSSCPYPAIPINDAAIRLYGAPASPFISNSEISDSLSNGIDRGWASDDQPDFLAGTGNSFMNIGRCTQTVPKDSNNGGCPDPVPCPQPD